MDAPLLTAAGFAELVSCDQTTITRMCRKGQLSHYRVGTHYRLDRDEALAEMRHAARPTPAPAAPLPVATEPRTPAAAPTSSRLDRRALKAELYG